MRDATNNIDLKTALAPVVVGDSTAQVCAIIDRKGSNAMTYLIATGTLADTDATFAALLEEGDESDLSDAAAVADADMIGTEASASFTFAEDASVLKLGYKGNKRYTRLTITPTGNTGSAPLAVVALMARPSMSPTANPPA